MTKIKEQIQIYILLGCKEDNEAEIKIKKWNMEDLIMNSIDIIIFFSRYRFSLKGYWLFFHIAHSHW
jgi:hypothetical protein